MRTEKELYRYKSMYKVVNYIKENPHCTAHNIAEGTGVIIRTAQKMIKLLLDENIIHISHYERIYPTSGNQARLFVYGPGRNAIPQKASPAVVQERKNEYLRRKRSTQGALERASQHEGPFSIMLAQLVKR